MNQASACFRSKVTHWKLNTTILHEDDYKQKVRILIRDMATLMDAYADVTEWWDDLKARIKVVTISYCSKRKMKLKQKFEDLKAKLDTCSPGKEYAILKDQLRDMYEARFRITNIQSNIERDLMDEKCNSYFFKRTRDRRKKNSVVSVRNQHGHLVEGTDQVLEVFRAFYESLYEKHENVSSDELEWLFPHPPPNSQSSSEDDSDGSGLVTFEADKLEGVLKGMNVSKAPGPDGLPPEFYQTFFADIVDYILRVFRAIGENDVLPGSWKEAITVLIQKDGDPTDPANQRPISLLNSDCKLFTKYLNEVYVQQQLAQTIPSYQLCSVRGRSIHDGLILIRDIIEYERTVNGQALIVALDQRKAFDMVDHEVLFRSMTNLGLSSGIVRLVKMLYKGNQTKIKVNGELSDAVYLNRGVRQGCPLSASLYIVYLQVFLNILTSVGENGLRGIKIPGPREVKLSVYADDIVLFCNDDYEVQQSFAFFEKIEKLTGSQLNKGKTEILNIGGSEIRTAFKPFVRDEVKVCGVIFSDNTCKAISDRNVKAKQERMEKKLDKLKFLRVSLRGKVLLINSVIHSQLYFLSGVYLPSNRHLEEIRRLSFRFLWDDKREAIKRVTIETSKDHGGLGLGNIAARCKAIYFDCNVQRPSRDDFDHQRLALFKYFFAFKVRNMYPYVFSNSHPHMFALCDPYKSAQNILDTVKGKLDCIAPLMVTTHQLYHWLLPEEEDVPIVFDIHKDLFHRVFALWKDGILAVRDKDIMWRTALGGLKTGSFISRYKIPGANVGCEFCPAALETAEHLLLSCPRLHKYREKVLKCVVKVGCTIRPPPHFDKDRSLILLLGLCPLQESKVVARDVFSIVAKGFRALWAARNEAHFGAHQGNPDSLISVVKSYCQRILDGHRDHLL